MPESSLSIPRRSWLTAMFDPRFMPSYILGVYVLAWTAQILIIPSWRENAAAATPWLALVMFVPALVAGVWTKRLGLPLATLGLGRARLTTLGIAALLPALLALAAVCLFSRFGIATSEGIRFDGSGADVTSRLFLLSGPQGWSTFVANVLASSLRVAFLGGLFAVGEEIGWRGFLQPRLIARYGPVRGVTFLALAWSFFHAPLLLAGFNYPETPILGTFVLFPLTLLGFSFFLAAVTERSGAIWPAVLAHGSVNGFFGNLVAGMQFNGGRLTGDLALMCLFLALGALSALWLVKARARQRTSG